MDNFRISSRAPYFIASLTSSNSSKQLSTTDCMETFSCFNFLSSVIPSIPGIFMSVISYIQASGPGFFISFVSIGDFSNYIKTMIIPGDYLPNTGSYQWFIIWQSVFLSIVLLLSVIMGLISGVGEK